MEELWKYIEELNCDYQVSNLGRIKSKSRLVEFAYRNTFRQRLIKEKILKTAIKKTGDRLDSAQIQIRDQTFLISHLVYYYFISNEPIPKDMCIAHKNKNPLDNRSANLILVSWSNSRKLDFKLSKRTKVAQLNMSKLGAKAMKRKAFVKKLKWYPNNR